MEWSFAGVGPVQADVEVPAGEVELKPVEDNQVVVSLEPWGRSDQKAEEVIAASEVSFDAGRLRVRVPQRPFRSTEIRCTIVLPTRSSVRAKTASADVEAHGTLGDFTVVVASGDVSLERIEGELSFTSASGDLSCEVVTGRLKAKGASSDVSVTAVGGPVDVTLASGDVSIGDAATSVKVATASGDFALGCAHEGEVRIKSASGDITVGVAPGVGAYLDVMSISGEMSSELPVEGSGQGSAQLSISCQTMSGDVRIRSAAVGAGSLGHD